MAVSCISEKFNVYEILTKVCCPYVKLKKVLGSNVNKQYFPLYECPVVHSNVLWDLRQFFIVLKIHHLQLPTMKC